jgi:endonuclease/exonuclease/phosphatase family metal-dependent hydrolase
MGPMHVFSWNVNGRLGKAADAQIEQVLELAPDVIALQELTSRSYPAWSARLLAAGYSVASTIDLVGVPYPMTEPQIHRKYFNLTATRMPVAPLPGLAFEDPAQAELAFPEKYLAVAVRLPSRPIEIHNAHLPPGSTRGVIKIQAFDAIRKRVDRRPSLPRILCGDFNTPQAEDDASLTTWASAHPDVVNWDAAERLILEHPELRDVYRECRHDGEPFAYSHLTRGTPRRYDHIFVSPEFQAVRCRYITDWLVKKLSDHAPLEADLELREVP